jgi:outer membrane lipoprotein SlyB
MTNGTVANTSTETTAPPVQGTMTNGTVASNSSKSGGKELTITYNDGQKVQVLVPQNTPLVRFSAAKKSILQSGQKAFVVASGDRNGTDQIANFVAVGKNGLMPPM